MTTLEHAWEWYQSNRRQLRLVGRLASKHAKAVLAVESVRQDDKVREGLGTAPADADAALAPLDDLAVLVLFSVFEATVRQGLLTQIEQAEGDDRHPIIRKAVSEAKQGVESGSFYNNVLTPYKLPGGVDPNLIEEVNQVRKYRNFVAHGKRGREPEGVTPAMAYERLGRYLLAVGLVKPKTGEAADAPADD